jgi:hypothetical protein
MTQHERKLIEWKKKRTEAPPVNPALTFAVIIWGLAALGACGALIVGMMQVAQP